VSRQTTSPVTSIEPDAFLAALTESAEDAIVSKTLDGVITTWNKAAERLFGYSRTEAVGRPVTLIVPKHLIGEERSIMERLRRGERIEHLDTVRAHKDGHLVEVSLTISPIKDEHGIIIGASNITRDITERNRLLAELRSAIEARDTFLSVASHELRTPLNTLQLLIHTTELERAQGKDAQVSLAAIQKQATRLKGLVDRLLDVSRISTGRLELERESMDLCELTREVVGRFRDEAAQKGSAIELQCAVPEFGYWDPLRLDQVLTNLVSNAIKYGEGKPILVSITGKGRDVEVVVEDHGIGIAELDQKKLFTRFERLVSARHFAGLGLGLWISAQIIAAHGGHIAVESDIGKGARFRFTLDREGKSA
jgi:PAS domain S-box-containing protein